MPATIHGAIASHMRRDRSKKAQGPKFVDGSLCTRCEKGCPYKAIYTRKYRGKGHYPGPTEELRKKLEDH